MKYSQDFKIVAVSSNTNSFGLKQMIMVAKDGTAFKGCFNSLNVKNKGETITAEYNTIHFGDRVYSFPGGELVEKLPHVQDKEIINEIFK